MFLILGLVMIAVVMFSYKCSINPDNVATPIGTKFDLLPLFKLIEIFCLPNCEKMLMNESY